MRVMKENELEVIAGGVTEGPNGEDCTDPANGDLEALNKKSGSGSTTVVN